MRINANTTYEQTTTWNTNLNVGDKLEGTYERKEEFDYDGKHKVKYVILAPDGVKYGVFGTAVLDRLFNKIPVGSYVWIEYTGKSTTKKGNPLHTFNVDYDTEYKA